MVSTVSFVLSLIDDFTGKKTTNDHYVFFINDKVQVPIYKEEGYYVFLNIPGQTFSVGIRSSRYYDTVINVIKSALPYEVRLYRNGAYFPDCEYIKGQCEANETIRLEHSYEPVLKIKEIVSVKKQTHIVLQGYGLKNLSGLRFAIGDKAKKESFIMGERVTANSYVTIPPIKDRYGEGSQLLRCYITMGDDIGRYCLPVDKYINTDINMGEGR